MVIIKNLENLTIHEKRDTVQKKKKKVIKKRNFTQKTDFVK